MPDDTFAVGHPKMAAAETAMADSRRGFNAYRQIDSGDFHTCAIQTDHRIVCWGDDSSGQASPPQGLFVTLSAGATHTCALDDIGRAEHPRSRRSQDHPFSTTVKKQNSKLVFDLT